MNEQTATESQLNIVSPETPRKRGGQPGNQNARTHGFYSRKADPAQQEEAAEASEVSGLDEDIELLRRKIRHIEETKPEEVVLIAGLIRTLSLVMSRRRYAGSSNVISGVAKTILGGIGVVGVVKDVFGGLGGLKK